MGKGRLPFVWTPELTATLQKLYPDMHTKDVADKMGMSYTAVKSRATVLKLHKSKSFVRNPNVLTKDELAFIKQNYFTMTIDAIAAHLGRGESTVQNIANKKLGLHGKPNSGCIKKGNRPANWNKKRPGWSVGRMKESQFKKGHAPANTLHDGAITIRYDHPKTRSGRAYKWIRISNGKWVHYHRYLWEQKNGPVPPKHLVIFKNGDTLDTRLNNLKMITMAENARRNHNPDKAHSHSKALTDHYIATRLAPKDKKLQKSILLQTPGLIDLKRTQLTLNRQINERRKQTQEAAQ